MTLLLIENFNQIFSIGVISMNGDLSSFMIHHTK